MVSRHSHELPQQHATATPRTQLVPLLDHGEGNQLIRLEDARTQCTHAAAATRRNAHTRATAPVNGRAMHCRCPQRTVQATQCSSSATTRTSNNEIVLKLLATGRGHHAAQVSLCWQLDGSMEYVSRQQQHNTAATKRQGSLDESFKEQCCDVRRDKHTCMQQSARQHAPRQHSTSPPCSKLMPAACWVHTHAARLP